MAGASNSYVLSYPFSNTCPFCNLNFKSQGLLLEHLSLVHLLKVIFNCSLCSKNSTVLSTISSHHSKCKKIVRNGGNQSQNFSSPSLTSIDCPLSVEPVGEEDAEIFSCEFCDYSTSTRSGLGQHQKHAHIEQHSKKAQPLLVRKTWEPVELETLAKINLEFESDRFASGSAAAYMTKRLLEIFPERNLDMVKGALKSKRYANILKNVRKNVIIVPSDKRSILNPVSQTATSVVARAGASCDESSLRTDNPNLNNEVPALSTRKVLRSSVTSTSTNTSETSSHGPARRDLDPALEPDPLLVPQEPQKPQVPPEPDPDPPPDPAGGNEGETDDDLFCDPMSDDTFLKIIRKYVGEYPRVKGNRGKQRYDRNEYPTHASAKKRKRMEFARQQKLFRENKKELFELLRGKKSAEGTVKLQDLHDVFDPLFSSESKEPENCTRNQYDGEKVERDISIKDIKKAIKSTAANTAPGPDGATLKDLKMVPELILVKIFSNWLRHSIIPNCLRDCRTTFIPKGNEKTAQNSRPITISSIFYRIFTKILSGHLTALYNFDDHQSGFIRDKNIQMNLLLTQALIKYQKKRRRSLFLCTIDISKAFDSISHRSIFRALEDARCPATYVKIIKNLYDGVSTTFSADGMSDRVSIPMLRGINQGDPLSPFLFNLVIDPLLKDLSTKHGVEIDGKAILASLAYADDLLLFSDTKTGLLELIQTVEQFLGAHHLKINPQKCNYFGFQYNGNRKKFSYHLDPIKIYNTPVVSTMHSIIYLGVDISCFRPVSFNFDKLTADLDLISSARLKPKQKLQLFKAVVLPWIYFALSTMLTPLTAAERANKIVRNYVKGWFHLPPGFPTALVEMTWKDGGLSLGNVVNAACGIFCNNITRILRVSSSVFDFLLNENTLKLSILKVFKRIGLRTVANTRREISRAVVNTGKVSIAGMVQLYANPDISAFTDNKTWNRFLSPQSRLVSPRDHIQALKMRSNLLPVRAVTNRASEVPAATACRRCKGEKETLHHILQVCPRVQGARIRRHDYVTQKAARAVAAVHPGSQIEYEKLYVDLTGARVRPDAIVTSAATKIIIESAITWERSLDQVFEAKVSKYTPLVRVLERDGFRVRLLVVCCGARGSICSRTMGLAREVGLDRLFLERLAADAVIGSLCIFSKFMAI